MALLMPQSQLARNVDAILSQIRKGCARARVANMGDPTLGIMVDLPDGVEFEITVVREYQTLSRISEERNNGFETGSDTTTVRSSETTAGTGKDQTSGTGTSDKDNESKKTSINKRTRATSDDKSRETSSEDTTELGNSVDSVELAEASNSRKSSRSRNTKSDRGSGRSRINRITKKERSIDNKEATIITESKVETDVQAQTGGKSTKGVIVDYSSNSRAYSSFEDETGVLGGQLTLGLRPATPSLGICPTE